MALPVSVTTVARPSNRLRFGTGVRVTDFTDSADIGPM